MWEIIQFQSQHLDTAEPYDYVLFKNNFYSHQKVLFKKLREHCQAVMSATLKNRSRSPMSEQIQVLVHTTVQTKFGDDRSIL